MYPTALAFIQSNIYLRNMNSDQYNHPLLWCESKRRAEEKRIADESWVLTQQRKEQTEAQKRHDCNDVSKCQLHAYIFCC